MRYFFGAPAAVLRYRGGWPTELLPPSPIIPQRHLERKTMAARSFVCSFIMTTRRVGVRCIAYFESRVCNGGRSSPHLQCIHLPHHGVCLTLHEAASFQSWTKYHICNSQTISQRLHLSLPPRRNGTPGSGGPIINVRPSLAYAVAR